MSTIAASKKVSAVRDDEKHLPVRRQGLANLGDAHDRFERLSGKTGSRPAAKTVDIRQTLLIHHFEACYNAKQPAVPINYFGYCVGLTSQWLYRMSWDKGDTWPQKLAAILST